MATVCGLGDKACQVYHVGERDENNVTYGCFRIPAVVRTQNGSLLAFAEGRIPGCRPDMAPGNPIVVRTSTDEGVTWSPIRVAVHPGSAQVGLNYATPLITRNGTILLLYTNCTRYNESQMAVHSDDHGQTWGGVINISAQLGSLNCGSPGGVLLPNTNRVVLACSPADGRTAFAIFSDDDGKTWSKGSAVPGSFGGGEGQLVLDGRGPTMLSMVTRVSSNNSLVNHALATSEDGGESWSSQQLLSTLQGTTCQGSIAHPTGDIPGRLLLSAPHLHDPYLSGRGNLTVWDFNVAHPEKAPEVLLQVWPNAAGYSSLDASRSGNVGILFEAGHTHYDWTIMFSVLS